MGSILFSFFCPQEIKRYASAFDMVDAERGHRTGQQQTERLSEEVKDLYARMSNWERLIFPLPRLRPDEPNMGVNTLPELKSSDQWGLALIHVWTVQDIKHPKLRIFIFVLFGAGLLAIAIPAAITFINVTEVGVKHLFASLLR